MARKKTARSPRKQVSRTERLRQSGARVRGGGGGGAPFVKWDEEYGFIEGRVLDVWEGKYGDSAKLLVTDVSPDLQVTGTDEDGEKFSRPIEKGEEVNVGLSYAALEGMIKSEDVGSGFHIAFEGWGESAAGDRFRQFAVVELSELEDDEEEDEEEEDEEEDEEEEDEEEDDVDTSEIDRLIPPKKTPAKRAKRKTPARKGARKSSSYEDLY